MKNDVMNALPFAEGLAMGESPRWWHGQLWVCELGRSGNHRLGQDWRPDDLLPHAVRPPVLHRHRCRGAAFRRRWARLPRTSHGFRWRAHRTSQTLARSPTDPGTRSCLIRTEWLCECARRHCSGHAGRHGTQGSRRWPVSKCMALHAGGSHAATRRIPWAVHYCVEPNARWRSQPIAGSGPPWTARRTASASTRKARFEYADVPNRRCQRVAEGGLVLATVEINRVASRARWAETTAAPFYRR